MDLMQGFVGPAGSGAPIAVNTIGFENGGHYADQPVLKHPNSGTIVERRDIANATNAVTMRKFTSRNDLGVFTRFRANVNLGEDAARIPWGVSMEMFVESFMNKAIKDWTSVMQEYCIGIVRGALDNMTSTLHTKTVWSATEDNNLTTALLMQILQTLTDKQREYAGNGKGVWVFKSGPCLDLGIHQEGRGVQGISDYTTRTGMPQTLGIPYVVAEDSSLETTDAGFDKYYSLFLGPECLNVRFERPRLYVTEQRLDTEEVGNYLRMDMDAYFQVPGFEWDDDNGGLNPTAAAIKLSSNWDVLYDDHREVAMSQGEHNYSGDL